MIVTMPESRPIFEFSAGGLVVDVEGRVLLIRARDLRNRAVWTLPKGALAPGEQSVDAALREVREETGLRCDLGRPIGCTAYVDRRGRDKVACYWVMEVRGGRFKPGIEVDRLLWLPAEDAVKRLTYGRDKTLLLQQDL